MTVRPFSADLQRNFRDQTGCPGAPKVIDDELPAQAVILMGANFDTANNLYVRQEGYPSVNPNQTLICTERVGVANGSVFYTVTTGKTFYLMGYSVDNAGVAGSWSIGNGGGNRASGYLNALGSKQIGSSTPICTVPSGTQVLFNHGFGGSLGYAQIWGYEQ